MWGWIKNVFGVGTETDYSPDMQYRRDAAAEIERAKKYNSWFPELGYMSLFPTDFETWYRWFKGGKPRHIPFEGSYFPGSNPQIDAAFSQIDPSYMSGTSEAEWVLRKRRGE